MDTRLSQLALPSLFLLAACHTASPEHMPGAAPVVPPSIVWDDAPEATAHKAVGGPRSSSASAAAFAATVPALQTPDRDGMQSSFEEDNIDLSEHWEFLLVFGGFNNDDFNGGSTSLSVAAGYFLNEETQISVRQGFAYSDGGPGVSSAVSGATRVALDYHFDFGRVLPFVGANVGMIYGDRVRDVWTASPEVGVKWYIKDEAFIVGLIEYQIYFQREDSIRDALDEGSFIYSIGIGLKF